MSNEILSPSQKSFSALRVAAVYNNMAVTKIAALVEVATGRRFELGKSTTGIGRSLSNDIVIDGDLTISRQHAQILFANGGYYLTDLQSANGTLHNSRAVDRAVRLKPEDIVYVGRRKFVFCPSKHHHYYMRGEAAPATPNRVKRYARKLLRPILDLLAAARGESKLHHNLG